MPNADTRVAVPSGERQYHIGLGPGELADYILLPGDQDRVDAHRGALRLRRAARTATASSRARPACTRASASRASPPASARTTSRSSSPRSWRSPTPTFIRIGSCGALQPGMELGDLVISTGSVRLETTTNWFVHEGYPAVAHYEAVLALVEAAERLGHRRHHVGITATAPGFYGAQGRPDPAASHPIP